MAKYFSTFIILFFFQFISAQNISLEDLISFRTKEIGDVEESLTSKNWIITESEKPTEETIGAIRFTFYNSSQKINSFLNFYYDDLDNQFNRISLNIFSIETYNAFIKKIKSLGFKNSKSFVDDKKNLKKIYTKNNIVIQVSISDFKYENESTVRNMYSFFVYNIKDYDLLKEK